MTLQIENGQYMQIMNVIVERLASAKFNGTEYACILFLLRRTYGWKKVEDTISLGQWEEGTGQSRRGIIESLQRLESRRVFIAKSNGGKRPKTFRFNKYFDQWDPIDSAENCTTDNDDSAESCTSDSAGFCTKLVQDSAPTKERKKEKEKGGEMRINLEAEPFPTPTPTTPSRPSIHKNIDPRKIINGLIPAGTGSTPFEVYREVFTANPSKTQITAMMTTATNLEKWRTVCNEWTLKGYRANNFAGLLDVYQNGWRSGNGYNGNTAQVQAPATVGVNLGDI